MVISFIFSFYFFGSLCLFALLAFDSWLSLILQQIVGKLQGEIILIACYQIDVEHVKKLLSIFKICLSASLSKGTYNKIKDDEAEKN